MSRVGRSRLGVATWGLAAIAVVAACDGGREAPTDTPTVARPADIEELNRLAALGYVSGSVEATEQSGVTRHDRERAAPGVNLVLSGHAPGASLVDMNGRLLHEWTTSFHALWPGREVEKHFGDGNFFRRAHLYENGDLLAVWARSVGVLRLDRNSEVVWARTVPAHHDLEVLPDGRLLVLTMHNHIVPRVHPTQPLREDFIAVLGPDGELEREVSLLEAFENSDRYRFHWLLHPQKTGIAFHANTVFWLDGSLEDTMPEFSKGRVLTSMRAMSTIAVVDLERREVVWAHRGGFTEQHEPQILPDGGLLVFDNKDAPGRSAIEVYDPRDMSERWAYRGTAEEPFYTQHSGAAQPLGNGNLLVTESANGRAFEITPAGEIVWEYFNPHRTGQRDELRATLHEVTRLPPDFDLSWLPKDDG